MRKNPLLSVIVPVYNVENYLCQCLDSLLAQDFSDYEVILVDDGSTDKSGEICDNYTAMHSFFRCIHKANGGLPSARKCGYEASCGQYIAFVDSDDWIAPDMYRRMCQAVYDTHADIIHCGYIAAMSDKEVICRPSFPTGYYDKKRLLEEVYPHMLYSGTFFKYGIAPNFWNKIFRRELLKNHLFQVPDDITVGEDALATYSCMLEASSMYFIDEAFYYYRSNAASMSRKSIPVSRLTENHKMFDTLRNAIDLSAYPCMEQQLDYFFVYQSLLTFTLIFKNMTLASHEMKKIFATECKYPLIHKAFTNVPIRNIAGTHNKLYAFCIRHKLAGLFRLLVKN